MIISDLAEGREGGLVPLRVDRLTTSPTGKRGKEQKYRRTVLVSSKISITDVSGYSVILNRSAGRR